MYQKFESTTEIDGKEFYVLIVRNDGSYSATVKAHIDGKEVIFDSFTTSLEDAEIETAKFVENCAKRFEEITNKKT